MKTGKRELDQLRSEGELNLSERRQAWRERQSHEATRDWLDRDDRYFLHQSLSTPCLDVLDEAKGSSLRNLEGDRYLDFHGNSVHQVGYGHPKVVEAISSQLASLPFCPRRFTNAPAIELAQKVTEIAPDGLDRALFTPGGTSAMGIALKLVRNVTGRHKTISMWDSFHGASLDAISIGGEAMFRKEAGPLLPGTEHVPPPNPALCPFKCGRECSLHCADYVDYVLEKEGDVAAVVSETVSSVPCIPPYDYWRRIRESCDKHGALLVLDEIPHSLGRTGKMLTLEHYDITPDILVLGKGLGGGVMPLAAVVAKDQFNVAGKQSLGHYTHEKNPVACAAGLATLEIIEDEQLLDRADRMGAYAIDVLRRELADHPAVADIRGLGLLMGVELKPDSADLAEKILYRCLRSGLSFKISMGNVLTLAPPLTISQDDLDRALQILNESMRTAT